jgi:hypothetical protein
MIHAIMAGRQVENVSRQKAQAQAEAARNMNEDHLTLFYAKFGDYRLGSLLNHKRRSTTFPVCSVPNLPRSAFAR